MPHQPFQGIRSASSGPSITAFFSSASATALMSQLIASRLLLLGGFLMCLSARYAALFVLLLASVARAAETETEYLSGLGKDDPVKWEFICDKGQSANKWSTIGVPSN